MSAELVQAATVLAGSGVGGWFADKLLGPSAEALGDQLRVYASSRLNRIFKRTEQITRAEAISPLSPGFALVLFQRASISEDSPELTEMWAQLIASASQRQTNRHVIYADILSQIGADEAAVLQKLQPPDNEHFQVRQQAQIDKFRSDLGNLNIVFAYGFDDAEHKLDLVSRIKHEIVGELSRLEIFVKNNEGISSLARLSSDAITLGILERQRVLESVGIQSANHHQGPRVHFSVLTELGADFLMTCRGLKK